MLAVSCRHSIVIAIGFSAWKEEFVRQFYSGRVVLFLDKQISLTLLARILKQRDVQYVIWSFKDEELGLDLTECVGHDVWHMEDGFIRSVGRGLDHVPPWSLCLDSKGAYFDASRPSDLEDMLNRFKPEDMTKEQRSTARRLMKILNELKVDKYNIAANNSSQCEIAIATGAILVLGQVEDDQSILRNNNLISTNAELLQRAIDENPECQIFFKQHPDCVGNRKRPGFVHLTKFEGVEEISQNTSLAQVLNCFETVYTISSLGGLEALMRDCEVVTFGAPFYAGWGLTKDRGVFHRRKNKLALDELVYVAYMCYPYYLNPYNGQRLNADEVVKRISSKQNVH